MNEDNHHNGTKAMTDILVNPIENKYTRLIPLKGIRNMRDMGGYATCSGQTIAWGKLFRSASLFNATSTDIDFLLGTLCIKHIIDLRNASETIIEHEPDTLLANIQYHWLPILVEGTAREDLVARLKSAHPEQHDFCALLIDVNERLAIDHQADFKQWFSILLNHEGPFLFHCTEGKDRTGFASALLMSALGVDRETIFADYLLTNTVNAESIEDRIKNSLVLSSFQVGTEQLKQLLMAHRDYLQAAFSAIDKNYGSMDNYLVQALGVGEKEQALLRSKFCQ